MTNQTKNRWILCSHIGVYEEHLSSGIQGHTIQQKFAGLHDVISLKTSKSMKNHTGDKVADRSKILELGTGWEWLASRHAHFAPGEKAPVLTVRQYA